MSKEKISLESGVWSLESENRKKKNINENKIVVKYKRSCIGRPKKQKQVLQALGLHKLNQEKVHQHNPVIRGMLKKVHHLVEVKEIKN